MDKGREEERAVCSLKQLPGVDNVPGELLNQGRNETIAVAAQCQRVWALKEWTKE